MIALDTPCFYLPIIGSVLILVIAQVTYCLYLYVLTQRGAELRGSQHFDRISNEKNNGFKGYDYNEGNQLQPANHLIKEAIKEGFRSIVKSKSIDDIMTILSMKKSLKQEEVPKVYKEIEPEKIKIKEDLNVKARGTSPFVESPNCRSSDTFRNISRENLISRSSKLDKLLDYIRSPSDLQSNYRNPYEHSPVSPIYSKLIPNHPGYLLDFPHLNHESSMSHFYHPGSYILRDGPSSRINKAIIRNRISKFKLAPKLTPNPSPVQFTAGVDAPSTISWKNMPSSESPIDVISETTIRVIKPEHKSKSHTNVPKSKETKSSSEHAIKKSKGHKTSKKSEKVKKSESSISKGGKSKKKSKKGASSVRFKTKNCIPTLSPNAADKLLRASEILKIRANNIERLKNCQYYAQCQKSHSHRPNYLCFMCPKPSVLCFTPNMSNMVCAPTHSASGYCPK